MTYIFGKGRWPLLLSPVAGALIAFGLLTIFALYGLLPFLAGLVLIVLIIQQARGVLRWQAAGLALVSAVIVLAALLWGAEHVWAQPSCQQHANQSGGSVTYWSGAQVTWKCVNGHATVTKDTR